VLQRVLGFWCTSQLNPTVSKLLRTVAAIVNISYMYSGVVGYLKILVGVSRQRNLHFGARLFVSNFAGLRL
jgi:hypothetical protein